MYQIEPPSLDHNEEDPYEVSALINSCLYSLLIMLKVIIIILPFIVISIINILVEAV